MTSAASYTCVICKKVLAERPKTFPFCSTRCKQVDLGKWLNEDYRMPAESSEASDGEATDDVGDGAEDS